MNIFTRWDKKWRLLSFKKKFLTLDEKKKKKFFSRRNRNLKQKKSSPNTKSKT